MPINASPTSTVPIPFPSEEGEGRPPTFHARFLTVDETTRAASLLTRSDDEPDRDARRAILNELFALLIVRHENVVCRGEPVAQDAPGTSYLHDDEFWELVTLAREATKLKLAEKKAWRSALASQKEPTAPPAPPAAAPTAPPPPSRP